ncbi:camp-regulated phosphoprotein/endosulfine conserved region-domain-containing protein [Xylaria flabelliformis]|nr:camp-regulated phosphoprotein/endosulfine conserved region-domain-containing protein [Xylaria flabelliformis]KAI0855243.1 camp-regulated phosphoprotein/endosulfine conserved region-domain-containing protein [Xylaria cubensis]
MNPHQKNKIDISSLTPDEQRLFRLYGKLPSKSDHFAKHLKERKYFDSGDYAMSKAGKGDKLDTGSVGSQHPVPENIPHLSSPSQTGSLNGGPGQQHHPSISGGVSGHQVSAAVGLSGSPVKESSLFKSESSASDETDPNEKESTSAVVDGAEAKGIPIRR